MTEGMEIDWNLPPKKQMERRKGILNGMFEDYPS